MRRDGWGLDPDILFLNHGSFGACPTAVLDEQARLRAHLEREPVRFFVRELEGRLDEARAALAAFIGTAPEDLAWVPNATFGVNAVLRSLALAPGDELVATDHGYNACRNALDAVAAAHGARVVVARVPFPVAAPEEVVDAVLAAVGPRTRLALLDHVTSPTGLVWPVARLVAALRARGVETLVDGAHAPGMLPLDLQAIDADYYTGNCHKWICAPKGAGFLVVRRALQPRVRPVVISHGANSPRTDRSRFLVEFDWTGTADPTAVLCVPAALRAMAARVPGGWPEVMARNRALALAGRRILCDALGVAPPCPDEMVGSLAAVVLPDGAAAASSTPLYADPLGDALLEEHHIEVPVISWPWPAPPRRLVRISAQLYNEPSDYARLAEALRALLPATAATNPSSV
jgi:isopenicillin-N epimerase